MPVLDVALNVYSTLNIYRVQLHRIIGGKRLQSAKTINSPFTCAYWYDLLLWPLSPMTPGPLLLDSTSVMEPPRSSRTQTNPWTENLIPAVLMMKRLKTETSSEIQERLS